MDNNKLKNDTRGLELQVVASAVCYATLNHVDLVNNML